MYVHPIYDRRSSISASLLIVTQIWGHIAGPTPHYGSRLALFIARRLPFLSSLVDSRRAVPTHFRRSQQLILLLFTNTLKNLTMAGVEIQDQH